MSSVFNSDSTRSTRYGGADSQMTHNSHHSDNTSFDYLGENVLAATNGISRPPIPRPPPVPIHNFVDRSKVAEPASEHTGNTRLVIAIDYGTTFTGIAFALIPEETELVLDWGKLMSNSHKIPSIISYSPATINKERQFGADLSPAAIIHKNLKLQLDVQRRRIDGLELTLEVLEGTGNLSIDHVRRSNRDPAYAHKPPAIIITDYLTRVFECAWETIKPRYQAWGDNRPPVDVVVTVPVGWSYHATNATLRALRDAGFNENTIPTLNDMILLTEPEAASYFTVRHFQAESSKFLKLNEPFILVDAGGGTVDVISYQVKRLEPYLELAQVSEPTKDKCGATYIDTYFKRWLHKLIGEERYSKFDPSYSGLRIGAHTTESSDMRELIQQFDEAKKGFSNSSGPIRLDLPGPLSTLTIPGVISQGELTLQPGDMKAMFGACVSKIIPLIKDQKRKAEFHCKRRVRNLLLVGGFGESPYLREELEKCLNLREMRLRHPERMASWTAVVRGAVIYGIEKAHHKDLKRVKISPRSYGIVVDEVGSQLYDEDDRFIHPLTDIAMARGQFTWMIRKGDVMLSEKTEVAEKEFTRTFRASDNRRFDIPVYRYLDDDDDVPPRWATGQYDVEVVGNVRCDMTPVARGELYSRKNYDTGESYVLAYLTCKMRTTFTTLEVEMFVNETPIGRTTIAIGEEELRESRWQGQGPRAGSISSLES